MKKKNTRLTNPSYNKDLDNLDIINNILRLLGPPYNFFSFFTYDVYGIKIG